MRSRLHPAAPLQTRIERQDTPHAASASFDFGAANAFQSYVASALAFSIKRGGILYGTGGRTAGWQVRASDCVLCRRRARQVGSIRSYPFPAQVAACKLAGPSPPMWSCETCTLSHLALSAVDEETHEVFVNADYKQKFLSLCPVCSGRGDA